MVKRPWFREPLVHFSLAGLVLFGIHRLVAPTPAETIVVSRDTVERLAAQQTRKLGRAPDASELEAAISAWAQDEVLYREALALGLDRGDPIVRRRLMQKMAFVIEQTEPVPDPSDAELEAWIAEHRDRFDRGEQIGFTHVFVADPSDTPPVELAEFERALAGGADASTLGAAFVHGRTITSKSASELNRQFGLGFGDAVAAIEGGGWHRVRSTWGYHLVRVDEVGAGGLAELESVRNQAHEGVVQERRADGAARALERVSGRYTIVVEAAG